MNVGSVLKGWLETRGLRAVEGDQEEINLHYSSHTWWDVQGHLDEEQILRRPQVFSEKLRAEDQWGNLYDVQCCDLLASCRRNPSVGRGRTSHIWTDHVQQFQCPFQRPQSIILICWLQETAKISGELRSPLTEMSSSPAGHAPRMRMCRYYAMSM